VDHTTDTTTKPDPDVPQDHSSDRLAAIWHLLGRRVGRCVVQLDNIVSDWPEDIPSTQPEIDVLIGSISRARTELQAIESRLAGC
jgi:hypothetical protein